MRTIVPFVLSFAIAGLAFAQPGPQQIDVLEKKIADGRASVPDRITLMNLYMNARNVEKRREQVLWLAEHNPELPNFRNPPFHLGSSGFFPDPAGFDQEATIWRAHAAKPDATSKTIANAAWFFRFADHDFAWSLVKKAETARPGDPEIAKMRGILDVLDMGGVREVGMNRLEANAEAKTLPEAKQGRADIDASRDAKVIGSAADFLSQQSFLFNTSFQEIPALGTDDPLDVAEKWITRAREMEPANKEWNPVLVRIYQSESQQTNDANWKVALLRKADALAENFSGLPQLALAEFDAGNNDASAAVAHRMLERKLPPPPPSFFNTAHTVLGLIALDRKHVDEAKAELLQSASVTANIEPDRTLAQALLDAGERDAVIEYFEKTRAFWKTDLGAIDHYIKMVKAPGAHDIVTRYLPGQGLRGQAAPKLPIENYEGKLVAVQFRNAACKDCAHDFETIQKIADAHGAISAAIDAAGNEALVRRYDINTFPTVVLIDDQGRVAEFMSSRLDENFLRSRFDQIAIQGSVLRKLPAPHSTLSDRPGTLNWSAVPGAESYVVQWDQRDEQGWISDRGEHLVRVIPTRSTTAMLDRSLGETALSTGGALRWRVLAVSRFGPGTASEWNEIAAEKP